MQVIRGFSRDRAEHDPAGQRAAHRGRLGLDAAAAVVAAPATPGRAFDGAQGFVPWRAMGRHRIANHGDRAEAE